MILSMLTSIKLNNADTSEKANKYGHLMSIGACHTVIPNLNGYCPTVGAECFLTLSLELPGDMADL